jgi:hypothetical protein
MLTYFIPGGNGYTIRTSQTTATAFTMSLQDMLTQTNSTASIVSASYSPCESIASFTASIANAYIGQEFRVRLSNGTTDIWNGSLQVFAAQSPAKADYINQIPLDGDVISFDSDNEYIILNPNGPLPTTTTTTTTSTTTTTAAPTTTTTLAPTTTTTTAGTTTTTTAGTTTTTTTAAPAAVDANFFFGRQVGGNGFDVCISGSSNGNITEVAIWDYNLFMSSDSGCTTPYGTQWTMTNPPQIYFFGTGNQQKACSSGGSLNGTFYRTRISGSIQFVTQPGSVASPVMPFDISGSGFQDMTFAGRTLRINGAGCVLNDNTPGCP